MNTLIKLVSKLNRYNRNLNWLDQTTSSIDSKDAYQARRSRGGGGGAVASALYCHYDILKAYVSNCTKQRAMWPMPIALVFFLPLSLSQSLGILIFYRLVRSTSMNLSDHAQIGPHPIFKAPSVENMLWRPWCILLC